jgi:hypothetical protein
MYNVLLSTPQVVARQSRGARVALGTEHRPWRAGPGGSASALLRRPTRGVSC